MVLIKTLTANCNNCGATECHLIGVAKDWDFESCSNNFEYVTCNHCSHIYLKNRPTIDELGIIYPDEYSTYNYDEFIGSTITLIRNQVQKRKIEPIKNYFGQEARILDVGCGNGSLLSLIKSCGHKNWQLYGVDISPKAIEILEKKHITGIQGRFEDIEWNEREMPNVIIMNQIIEHLEDPVASVQKSYDLLEDGGILIIETPSFEAWDAQLFSKNYWGGWHCPRHWNIYTLASLTELVENCGFKVIQVDFMLNPYAWLHSFQNLIIDKWESRRIGKMFSESNLLGLVFFSMVDVIQRILTGKTSNMRLIVQKSNM